MPWGLVIGALISAGASYYNSSQQKKAEEKRQAALNEQFGDLDASNSENLKFLNDLLKRGPSDYQKEALQSNLSNFGSIDKLMSLFGDASKRNISESSGTFSDVILRESQKLGVDPTLISQAIMQESGRSLDNARLLEDRGRSMQDGSFYNTDMGRAQLAELQRTLGPSLSIAGSGQLSSQFAGAGSRSDVDSVTSFLRNFQETAAYGDSLLGQAENIRNIGAGRLGGLMNASLGFGQNSANMGFNLNTQLLGIGNSQLIDPNMAFRSDAIRMGIAQSLLQMNAQGAGALNAAQAGLYNQSQQNAAATQQALIKAGTDLGSAYLQSK